MLSLVTFTSPPHECHYLPQEMAQLQYDMVAHATVADYEALMLEGWRRFGHTFFRPVCSKCQACQSLRIRANEFVPSRSMKRVLKLNDGITTLTINKPKATYDKLQLYDKYQAYQHEHVGWSEVESATLSSYADSFVNNPFESEEWCYTINDELVGVGYVDAVASGMSLIYFYYDPDRRDQCLGTFNVLMGIHESRQRGLPYTYLGYFVNGCRSLQYKERFRPSDTYDWHTKTWREYTGQGV
jgi:arginine-tRNA-protein transferase